MISSDNLDSLVEKLVIGNDIQYNNTGSGPYTCRGLGMYRVIQAMVDKDYELKLDYKNSEWTAHFYKKGNFVFDFEYCGSDSMPKAVCLAAVAACQKELIAKYKLPDPPGLAMSEYDFSDTINLNPETVQKLREQFVSAFPLSVMSRPAHELDYGKYQWNTETFQWEIVEEKETKAADNNTKLTCRNLWDHKWKSHTGLVEVYEYCEICDEKRKPSGA